MLSEIIAYFPFVAPFVLMPIFTGFGCWILNYISLHLPEVTLIKN
jgi:hypothetical protein